MNAEEMKRRTKDFGLRVLKLTRSLPKETEAQVVRHQLARCGTSVGANYRAAQHARSPAEFRSKLGNVEEEVDESCYWLEIIMEDGMLSSKRVESLHTEATEILKIVASSIRSSKRRDAAKKRAAPHSPFAIRDSP